jgi:glycosyltransferase involved in cell wall biosynthesis
LNIGFVSCLSHFFAGGAEYLWLLAARQALRNGHRIAASVARSLPPERAHSAPQSSPELDEIIRLGGKLFPRREYSNPTLQRRIDRLIYPFRRLSATRPDVLVITHAHAFDFCEMYGERNLDRLTDGGRIPYLINCQYNDDHTVAHAGYRDFARRMFDRAYKVVVISQHNLDAYRRQLALPLDNAALIYNPPNLADRSVVPWPAPHPDGVARFAFLGRLHCTHKGIELLLQALTLPVWADRKWRLTIYGKGPDREYLEAVTRTFRLTDRVTFAGHGADIRSVWAEQEVYVSPARGEGMPIALLEAMLCGRVAVATDTGIAREGLTDGETGFLAEGATPHSISNALDRAWAARDRWPEIGRRAHEAATRMAAPDPVAQLLTLLEAAAATRR